MAESIRAHKLETPEYKAYVQEKLRLHNAFNVAWANAANKKHVTGGQLRLAVTAEHVEREERVSRRVQSTRWYLTKPGEGIEEIRLVDVYRRAVPRVHFRMIQIRQSPIEAASSFRLYKDGRVMAESTVWDRYGKPELREATLEEVTAVRELINATISLNQRVASLA